MSSLLKMFLIAFLAISFGGCVPNEYPYKYISLEGISDLEVLTKGRSNLKGLKNHDEMPIKYEMKRDGYTLIFEVDKSSYWPSMIISVKPQENSILTIRGESLGKCGAFRSQNTTDSENTIRYVWAPPFKKNCSSDDALNDNHTFKVRVFRGEDLLGDELINYQLKANGTYTEYDGL